MKVFNQDVVHIEKVSKDGRSNVYCGYVAAVPDSRSKVGSYLRMSEPLRDALKRKVTRCEDCMKAVSTLEILQATEL